jgi:hypothetical protein
MYLTRIWRLSVPTVVAIIRVAEILRVTVLLGALK